MNAIVNIYLLLFTAFFLSANIATAKTKSAINQIAYFSSNESDTNPASALERFQAGEFEIQQGQRFNLGLTQGYFWLKVDINSEISHEQPLRLVSHAAYRPLLKAYIVENNSLTEILHSSINDRFSDRHQPFRFLSSDPFTIKQPDSFLLIRYQVIGSSFLKLQLLDEMQFNQLLREDTGQSSFFYSFSLASIIIFLLFSAAMQEKISLFYSLLFSLALLFIAAIEGFAFKHFWPTSPIWNHYSALVLLFLLSSAGFYLASIASQLSSYQHVFKKMTVALSLLCLILTACSTIFNFVLMAQLANVLLVLMFIAQTICIASWVKTGPQYNKITLSIAVPLTLSVLILVALSFNSTLLPDFIYFSANRVVYLIASLVTMSAIILHVAHLRNAHEKSMARELELTKREADNSKALFQAQQNFNRAQSLARLHQQQLASASHDMKQPLVSLRSSLDAATQSVDSKIKQQIDQALDYLNNLCNQHLQQTTPAAASNKPDHPDTEAITDEPYALQLLFDTVTHMFSAEAEVKNIELRCQSTSVITRQPATIIMRILSNLVGNAIKHCQNAKIFLGVRRRGNKLLLQVHDTGPGMSEKQLQTLSQAYQKGPESDGHGLGLAICQQLAEQYGMQLEIRSVPDRGTSICLRIDRVLP